MHKLYDSLLRKRDPRGPEHLENEQPPIEPHFSFLAESPSDPQLLNDGLAVYKITLSELP